MDFERVKSALKLEPLPEEGGFYREVYRTLGVAAYPGIGERNPATDIYFALAQGMVSALHRIRSDELWHYHLGGPMVVVELHPGGDVVRTVLGPDIENGHVLQHTVPAGVWFGSHPAEGADWSVVGATVVAPGFHFEDFELGERQALVEAYPKARDVIEQLTHP